MYSITQAAAAAGVPAWKLTHWSRIGLLHPAKGSAGHGDPRGFDDEDIIDSTEIDNLERTRLGSRHIRRVLAMHRRDLDTLDPAARVLKRYEQYIETIVTLAAIFGPGPDFDEWHARQQAQLATMRRDPARPAGRSSRRRDQRIVHLFTEAKATGIGYQPLAG